MQRAVLPHSLLDLTFAHVQSPTWRLLPRNLHQAVALAPPSPTHFESDEGKSVFSRRRRHRRRTSSLTIRDSGASSSSSVFKLPANFTSPMTELDRRVLALQNVQVSLDMTDSSLGETSGSVSTPFPGYSDEELFSIYEDLLEIAPAQQPVEDLSAAESSQEEDDQRALAGVERRLAEVGSEMMPDSGLAAKLFDKKYVHNGPSKSTSFAVDLSAEKLHRRIITRLECAIERLQATRVSSNGPLSDSVEDRIPIMILSDTELVSLIRVCVREGDLSSAETAIELMKLAGFALSEDSVNIVLGYYAFCGNIERFEAFMTKILSDKPSETQRDLHIKSYLHDPSVFAPRAFPTRAIELLHKYEASALQAPMKSYTRVISSLFSVRPSPSSPSTSSTPQIPLGRAAAYAQAWDLFAHMRYVAHPNPDAHLYAVMIRACASAPLSPEPERALDMWTEMLGAGIVPTQGVYDAVIRACAKAGGEWVSEAIRFAQKMRSQFGDGSSNVGSEKLQGVGGPRTWAALLDGCKRVGDLGRARWILAEAVRAHGLNEEIMQHMFHTYAAYRPPFKRGATRIVNNDGSAEATPTPSSQESLPSTSAPLDLSSVSTDVPPASDGVSSEWSYMDTMPSFSHLPPQSSGEVLAEARALFDRILQDTNPTSYSSCGAPPNPLAGKFNVPLTPRLLNAYMSVYYSHASVESAREVFDRLFSSGGVGFVGDARTYIDALERCALGKSRERDVVGKWVDELWTRWEELEHRWTNGETKTTVTARLVERAHAAVRRVHLLAGNVDRAIALIRTFMSRYPPTALLPPASNPSSTRVDDPSADVVNKRTITLFAKPPILSTRTILSNPPSSPRPLVRLTSVVGPIDERVPPLLSFADVELLHARLVEQGRGKDLGFLKWACKAYEGALRKRREAVLSARVPTGEERR